MVANGLRRCNEELHVRQYDEGALRMEVHACVFLAHLAKSVMTGAWECR